MPSWGPTAHCMCWNGVTDFGGNNADAQLSRVEFVGNLPTLPGDYNRNNVVDAADYAIWRDTLGQTGLVPFSARTAMLTGESMKAIRTFGNRALAIVFLVLEVAAIDRLLSAPPKCPPQRQIEPHIRSRSESKI